MQGPLSSTFPIENRITQVTMRALRSHLDRTKNLPFVKRISDFHLLLFLAKYLDLNSDVPALAECVLAQTAVPEGYQILIESMATTWCCLNAWWLDQSFWKFQCIKNWSQLYYFLVYHNLQFISYKFKVSSSIGLIIYVWWNWVLFSVWFLLVLPHADI